MRKRLLRNAVVLLLLVEAAAAGAKISGPPSDLPRHVRLSVQFVQQSDSVVLGLRPEAGGLRPRAERRSARTTSTIFLLIADGREGRISVGESVPNGQWFYVYSLGRGLIVPGTVFRTVSTGFKVTPTILAHDRIRLRITPEISFFTDRERGEVAFVEASMEVVVADGQPVMVAGDRRQTESVLLQIFSGYEQATGLSDVVMMVTPKIQ